MSRSIYWKITIPIVLIVIAVMSILAVYMTNSIRNTQMEQLRSHLTTQARLIADISLSDLSISSSYDSIDQLAKKEGEEINARITIIAQDGTVLGDTWEDPATMENHASRPEIMAVLAAENSGESIRYSSTTGQNMMYIAVPISGADGISGVVRIALPLTIVEETVSNTRTSIVWAMVIGALSIILMTFFIARMITRPVRRMTRAVQTITAGELGGHITVYTDDELGQLGHAFNLMSRTIEEKVNALSDEKSKLATILSGITDGIIITDDRGNILLANTATERLFNCPEEKMLNHSLIEITHNYEIEEVMKASIKTAQEKSAQIESLTGKFLQVIAAPLTTSTMSGALIMIQDLTQIRSLQTMRQEFLGNVSHELRTPLTTIKAIVETLQDGAIEDKEVARDFLDRVNNEIDGMTQMVLELIELSRIETGTVKLNRETINLNSLAREVMRRLNPLAERKKITLSADLMDNLPPVTADKNRIQQVISNIIHNGIKFTPEGGTVTIHTAVNANDVLLSVTDTGIGISRQDLPHVFERFFKADRSRSSSGTGIGLAIAKHTINAHGGHIEVQSTEGKGSTFTFSLPLGVN